MLDSRFDATGANMKHSTKLALALAGLFAFSAAHAADNREPLHVQLKMPVVKAAKQAATNDPARGVGLRIEDGRGNAAGAVIGRAMSDDDVLFPIIASNAVTPFVQDVVRQSLSSWNIDTTTAVKDATLQLRYAQFDINEKNRAVGATYVAEVKLDWTLLNRAGSDVAHGSVQGTTDHYGRGRSAENISETLSDALKDALAQLSNDSGFRKLWSDGFQNEGVAEAPRASAPAKPAKPNKRERTAEKPPARSARNLEIRLQKLDELYERKAITREEYDKRRAAILDEI